MHSTCVVLGNTAVFYATCSRGHGVLAGAVFAGMVSVEVARGVTRAIDMKPCFFH